MYWESWDLVRPEVYSPVCSLHEVPHRHLNKHWTVAWLGMSPLVGYRKASQGYSSSHAENDGVPHKQQPINGLWPVSQALRTDLSHENETSVLWVTCPKSVIGEASHGTYTSVALLFLANLQCLSPSGGHGSLPKKCWLSRIIVFSFFF